MEALAGGVRTSPGVNLQDFSNRRSRMRVALLGACIAAFVTIPGLWIGTLWDNSETAYSEVAREILLTHDAIVMHLNGAAWFIQPPLYFWLAALSAKIFGGSSFAYRLPAALSTVAMSACLAIFTRRYARARTARYAALILSTMLMQAVIGRLATMDALLDAFVMLTTLAWFRALWPGETIGTRGGSCIAGAITAALGVLTKGPVALVVPLLVLVPWALWERRIRPIAAPPRVAVLIAMLAFVFIAAPWYVLFGAAEGGHGVSELIVHYTFGRYVGTIENQTGPIYYYLPVLILGAFPWTPFLFPALRDAFIQRNATSRGADRASLLRFGAVWTIAPLVFFSFANTKLPNYVAVALPGAALLCAVWLDDAVARFRGRAFTAAATLPLLIALLAVAMGIFAHNMQLGDAFSSLIHDAYAFIFTLFCASAACVIALRRRAAAHWAAYLLGFGMIAAMMIVALSALPKAEAFKPIPPLASLIMQQKLPGDLIALQGVNGENALIFYTVPPIAVLDSPGGKAGIPQADPSLVLCSAPRIFLVAPVKRPVPDPTYGRHRRLIATSLKDALFFIDGPPCETTPE